MTNRTLLLSGLTISAAMAASADRIVHFPMEADSKGKVEESVGGASYFVDSNFEAENIPGAVGQALCFDGYSTFVEGTLKSVGNAAAEALTATMWVAPETYPVLALDTPTDEKMTLAGTIDHDAHTGWAFTLGYTGKYAFEFYSGGWKVCIEATDLLPCYEWSHLVAVTDGGAKKTYLYRNGVKVGEGKNMGSIDNSATDFTIGKTAGDAFVPNSQFRIKTFNGLIDEIEVFDTALAESDFANAAAENHADLTVSPDRFAEDTLRPRFHGMPQANWTNETHGMFHSNGRWHVFFQKNANGPYMTRLHWGHISSENLYDWREEKIAIMPDQAYDVKGCWSGCVFADDEITGGMPNIIYTGVDYAKAMISLATPLDENLIDWTKPGNNPIINGRPAAAALSDDFRDPYFFRCGSDAYIIVGSSKDGVGTTTLHKYNPATGNWSNNGDLFFTGVSQAVDGKFFEMPNVTDMGGGRFLFTTTPLETSTGVRTLYRVGSIDADGKFIPDANSEFPRQVELISRDGYGLLSPTIYQHDGKTIALGIVPDKVSGANNCMWGWAHLYSLPREWRLDDNGTLLQKPYSGLEEMRDADRSFSKAAFSLDGSLPMGDVKGREAEVLGEFVSGSAPFGFKFFKNGSSEAVLTYRPATGELTVDFTALRRLATNDAGVYDGIYRCTLPEIPAADETVKINLFIDHSILDIFVNDKWATSIRVFPTDLGSDEIEAFAEGNTEVKSLKGWTLTKENSGAGISFPSASDEMQRPYVDVYDMSGRIVKRGVLRSAASEGLEPGIYIAGGIKMVVK